MPFHMPKVNLDSAHVYDQRLLCQLLDHKSRLVTMPHMRSCFMSRLLHNELLKLLYRDSRWSVPLSTAWYMPHLDRDPSEKELKAAFKIAENLLVRNLFSDPQPIHLGNKLYLVTRSDGSTFEMEVA